MSGCVILLAVAAVAAGAAGQDLPMHDGYIVGGTATSIEKYPHQVSLEDLSNSFFCGGSIYSAKYIVTAAHCLFGETADGYRVRVGTSHHGAAGKLYAVEWHKSHPFFSPFDGHVDVAVIKLAEAITFGPTAQPIKLTSVEPSHGEMLTVTGWGTLHFNDTHNPSVLQAVRLPLIGRSLCTLLYGEETLTEAMLCAGVKGKDSCTGDSGGPLVNDKPELVGIVSFGSGCGKPGHPGIYTNIASKIIRNFILLTTQE